MVGARADAPLHIEPVRSSCRLTSTSRASNSADAPPRCAHPLDARDRAERRLDRSVHHDVAVLVARLTVMCTLWISVQLPRRCFMFSSNTGLRQSDGFAHR